MTDKAKLPPRVFEPKPGAFRFRLQGNKSAALPAPTSPEFAAAYARTEAEWLASKPRKPGRPPNMLHPSKPPSIRIVDGRKQFPAPMLGYAIMKFRGSDVFARKYRASTQVKLTADLDYISQAIGEMLMPAITPDKVIGYLESVRRKHSPSMASRHKSILSNVWLFTQSRLAEEIKLGIGANKGYNPARGIEDLYKVKQPHMSWPLELRELFKERCRPGLLLPFHLSLYLGCRRSDIVKLRRSVNFNADFTEAWLRTKKTNAVVPILLPDPLVEMLRAQVWNSDYVANSIWRRQYSEAGYSAAITETLSKIHQENPRRRFGADDPESRWGEHGRAAIDFVPHGLRKNAAEFLAEHGAQERELMTALGWETPKQAYEYIARSRKRVNAVANKGYLTNAMAQERAEAAELKRRQLRIVA